MLGISRSDGFALPTILIASIVMLTVLVSAVGASSSIRAALDSQYYDQLAREASESGANYALGCIRENGMVAQWEENGFDLTPAVKCDGTTSSGNGLYLVQNERVRTTFTAEAVKVNNVLTEVVISSKVELLRSSNSAAWRTFEQSSRRKVDVSSLVATTSATGRGVVCGIIDAQAWCWDWNDNGQLGDGTTTDSSTPVKVTRAAGVLEGKVDTDIAIGNAHTCSVSSGEVYCWGDNDQGQLGNGTQTDSSVPIKVTGLPGVATQVVATDKTTCAIVSGDVWCWGQNDYGELGIGVTGRRTSPVKANVIGTSTGLTVTQLATTPLAKNVCAIAGDRAYCWGRNALGQLGDNSTTQRLSPVAVYTGGVLGTKTVTDIATGGAPAGTLLERGTTCAVADGDVYCWGANSYGQLGIGSTSTSSIVPVKITSGLTAGAVTDVAVGYSSGCALANNVVKCWGYNAEGQVGDGTTTQRTSPVPITVAAPGLQGKTITDLTAGVNRGCVVASGITYCWGRNAEGQIGDGTTVTPRTSPTEATFLRQKSPSLTY